MTELNLSTGDVSSEAPAKVLTNDQRMAALKKQITKFGEEAALGKDSLPKLALAVVTAAAEKFIDVETKDRDGHDAAHNLYTAYAKAESAKAIHEHSDGGFKGNVSKLRQLIAFGGMTTIDAVDVIQQAHEARENMRNDSVKIKSAYPYYVDVARAQQKSDTALDMPTLEKLARKPEAPGKELEKELTSIMNRLSDLVTGEGRHGLKDDSELTEAAFHAIKERLDAMATLRAHMAIREAAAKAGIALA